MASFWNQSGGQFGASAGQAQPGSSLFGQSTQQQQQPSLFGQSTQQQQPSLFGQTSQQQQPILFGQSIAQQQPVQQQQPSLFGQSIAQQQPGQQQQAFNPLAQSGAQAPQQAFGGSVLGQSIAQPLPRLGQSGLADSQWRAHGFQPREKSVPEQMQLLFNKWNPESPDCAFQEYLYNQAPPDYAQFFHPGPGEDERKWEEALQKKPNPDAIPFLVRGFAELGQRMNVQKDALRKLQFRMNEINESLKALTEKQELQIEVRVQKAKQRHIELSRRVLRLAVTVQTLRNRGYAMDSVEERLGAELKRISKEAFNPVLGGRQEEVWARLLVLRERANIMQEELKKAGITVQSGPELTDEQMAQLKKILKDHQMQLDHLSKELDNTKTELETFEADTKTTT